MLLSTGLAAQDAAFTQSFASPGTLNPALTGLFEGRYRIALNHRRQWPQQLETPFTTSSFGADFHYRLNNKRRDSDSFGAGIYFTNDRVAGVGFGHNQFMLGAAYHKTLDARGDRKLSIGAQLGIAQQTFGYGSLTFQDEFNGTTGFVRGSGGELLPENSISYADYQLGLNYSSTPTRRTAVFTGLAMYHLTRPELSLYTDAPVSEQVEVTSRLYRRYSGYFNLRIPLTPDVTLSPRLVAITQGPYLTLTAGSTVRFLLEDASGTAVHLGTWLRTVRDSEGTAVESLTAFGGFEAANFLFGLSYDVGVSGRRVSPRHQSTFEISMTYLGLSEEDEAVPCPKF